MFRLTQEQEVKCAINGVIGLILCAGAIEVVGGVLTLQGTGSYEHFSPQARAGFSATYFLVALMCFGSAGSIYCNTNGTPKFLMWGNKSDVKPETSETSIHKKTS